ncbi:hypothetical protein T492DRAFT_883306, partial [Pavlovales sp. CCMP2436]
LFDAIARESEHRIGSFTPKELANYAWAFAVIDVARRDALVDAVSARASEIGGTAFSRQERSQLHQFFLSVELELCPPAKLLAPADLQLVCREALDGESPASSSKLHQDVSAELARMGIAHENELSVAASESRDDAMTTRAREAVRAATIDHAGITIEVDGPTHYLNEWWLRPASVMIRRHLALAGWVVLVVPYWD